MRGKNNFYKLFRSKNGNISDNLIINPDIKAYITSYAPETLSVTKVKKNNIFNKAGRISFRAQLNGVPIKIYEAANSNHALFIANISSSKEISFYFPSILYSAGRHLFAKWIDGDTPASFPIEEHFNLLEKIHDIPIESLPDPEFDYWYDFIKPRFKRACELFGEQDLGDEVIKEVSQSWSSNPGFLSHPDLTIHNMIRSCDDGHIFIIDNELLSVGHLPLLDFCNAFKSCSHDELQKVFAMWMEKYGLLDKYDLSILSAAWFARLVGSAFISGNFNKAISLIIQYKKDIYNILPFKIIR